MPTPGGILIDTDALIRFVESECRLAADFRNARAMAAYMKTDMPFYGIRSPVLGQITSQFSRRFPPETRADYKAAVLALWARPHREEKYAAISYARRFPRYVSLSSLPLYRKLIREGAWWDFVDGIAIKLVGRIVLHQPDRAWPTIDRWIDDRDMWIRRSALICQIDHKAATDAERLFGYCIRRMDEKAFFIRKAIGWALRQYSYTDPDAVRAFLGEHQSHLAGLSFREGAKGLRRLGLMD